MSKTASQISDAIRAAHREFATFAQGVNRATDEEMREAERRRKSSPMAQAEPLNNEPQP